VKDEHESREAKKQAMAVFCTKTVIRVCRKLPVYVHEGLSKHASNKDVATSYANQHQESDEVILIIAVHNRHGTPINDNRIIVLPTKKTKAKSFELGSDVTQAFPILCARSVEALRQASLDLKSVFFDDSKYGKKGGRKSVSAGAAAAADPAGDRPLVKRKLASLDTDLEKALAVSLKAAVKAKKAKGGSSKDAVNLVDDSDDE